MDYDQISGDFLKPQIKLFRHYDVKFHPTRLLHAQIWDLKSDVFAKIEVFSHAFGHVIMTS